MPNYPHLIAVFEDVATTGGAPLADELRRLSELTGRTVNHSVFSKWRRGERTPPPEALRYMSQMAVAAVLTAEGIDTLTLPDDALDRIAIALTPPPRH